jgi:putative acetyltransferase
MSAAVKNVLSFSQIEMSCWDIQEMATVQRECSALNMLIRNEQLEDRSAIRSVLLAAFPTHGEADLVDRLRVDGDSVFSLVAIEDEAVVGHVLFSKLKAPFRALGLAPVAVTPIRQRSGIGSALIRAGLKQAAQGGWQAVFVLGNPLYYSRFGFDVSLARSFSSPYAGPHFMAMAVGTALPVTTGSLEHAPAFQSLD